jgi:YD repeat-containing protein
MGCRARETGGHRRHGGATTADAYDAGNCPTQITDSVGGTITGTHYSCFDTTAAEVAPLGTGSSALTCSSDTAGRRTQMQVTGQTAVTYGYDDAHRVTSITQGTNVVACTSDTASRRTRATLPNGVTIAPSTASVNADAPQAREAQRAGATRQPVDRPHLQAPRHHAGVSQACAIVTKLGSVAFVRRPATSWSKLTSLAPWVSEVGRSASS